MGGCAGTSKVLNANVFILNDMEGFQQAWNLLETWNGRFQVPL
jgi:hypothetical protein